MIAQNRKEKAVLAFFTVVAISQIFPLLRLQIYWLFRNKKIGG